MRDIRVASVQFEHTANDKGANLAKVSSFVKKAARLGTEIVAFPECCVTGYWHLRHLGREQIRELAEPVFDVLAPVCFVDGKGKARAAPQAQRALPRRPDSLRRIRSPDCDPRFHSTPVSGRILVAVYWPPEFYSRSGLGGGTRRKLENMAREDLKND